MAFDCSQRVVEFWSSHCQFTRLGVPGELLLCGGEYVGDL